jgi:membrane associated rhomboid family serine protease
VSGVVGTASGVAHFAHLGGMFGAFAALRWFRPVRS